MAATIAIAQISDIHLGPIAGFGPAHWNVKRLLGFLNWHRNRRDVHRTEVAERLIADMLVQAPDHIAVTGDLANIGLPREHDFALSWLQGVGPPSLVAVIPGNHDIYCRSSIPGVERWRAYMASDAWGAERTGGGPEFPFVRRIGTVALIGVNSAVPTPPAIATGTVGAAQRRRLERVLTALGSDQVFRLVLVHHPPLPGLARPKRALSDARELGELLATCGAELVVHGHNHRNMMNWLTRPNGSAPVPVIGISSGSAARVHKNEPLARYNIYRITPVAARWQIEVVARGLAEPDGPVIELDRRLVVPNEAEAAEPRA